MFVDIWERFAGWWKRVRGHPIVEPIEIVEDAEIEPAEVEVAEIEVKPKRPPRRMDELAFGTFSFRDTILDQLDRYFVVLERMKKVDRQSYHVFSKVGAHIIPRPPEGTYDGPDTANWNLELSPWWRETLPMRGGVFFGDVDMDKHEKKKPGSMFPRAMHFSKYKLRGVPSDVQKVNEGVVYGMSIYWDKPGDRKWSKTIGEHGVVQEFPVVIEPGGSVHVLRMLETKQIPTQGKRQPREGVSRQFHVPQRRWGIPQCYVDWASDHKQDVHTYLRHIFISACETYMMATASMTRVAVTKAGLTGVFAVDVERTAYFFRDREVTVNDRGTRKRIFHIVRPHERSIGNRKSMVRMHFRGERQFNWNGYSISITVPGWHHLDVAEIDVGIVDSTSKAWREMRRRGERGITSKALAKKITTWVSDGIGGIWKPGRGRKG